ncbi:MAG: hypothetical protein AAFU85_20545 [Planctomycetota bacterium]
MNPFEPSNSHAASKQAVERSFHTYLHAFLLCLGLSTVAPLYFATYRMLTFGTPLTDSVPRLIPLLVPFALCCGFCGLLISPATPGTISRRLCHRRWSIPLVINSCLFSVYFAAVGYGLVVGRLSIGGFSVPWATVLPGLIVGVATFMHIGLRPKVIHSSEFPTRVE